MSDRGVNVGKFDNGSGIGREITVGENLAGPVSVIRVGEIVRLSPGFVGGISSLGGCAGERL